MNMLDTVLSTLGAYPDADVRTLLHADHKRIRELASELAEADSAPRRKSVLRELKPLLVAHSRAEEAAVYQKLMQARPVESRLAGSEGMVEHNLADILMDRLANTADATTDMWRAHAKVLHESLDHHVSEEESNLFADLGKYYTDEERASMGEQFERDKTSLLKAPAKRANRKRG